MKVLLVGDYPPPVGGIATHVDQLQSFLVSRGVEAQVLDIGKGRHSAPGVVPARSRLGYAVRLLRFASRGFLMHAHVSGDNRNSWLVIASVVIAAKLSRRRPLVTLHSGSLPGALPRTPMRRRLAAWLLRRCNRVIAVSEAIEDALETIGVTAPTVCVHPGFVASQIRRGLPPASFSEPRAQCRPLLSMADHPSPIYGRRTALQALRLIARRFPEAGLILFGPGPRAEAARAEAVAEGVAPRVFDLGELDHPAALGVMSRCDAFLRPTTADGDSMSVREAISLGIRCIASDASARPAGAVLFRSGDAADLAQKVVFALENAAPRAPSFDAGPILLAEYQRAYEGRSPSRIGEAPAQRVTCAAAREYPEERARPPA